MKRGRIIGAKEIDDSASAESIDNVEVVESVELQSPFKADVLIPSDGRNTPSITGDKKAKEAEMEDVSCPICSEKMLSLLQLNRHLDDEHGFGDNGTPTPMKTMPRTNTPSPLLTTPNEELRSWLKKTNEVRSKIQTALPRKFVNLDLFDSSNNSFSMSTEPSGQPSTNTTTSTNQPEITVKRSHWQRPTGRDKCTECHKTLNIKNGLVNCRKCGLLFCNSHSDFKVKLNENAQYDHEGVWSRCCTSCFQGKPGYNDYGLYEDLTKRFTTLRQKKVDERDMLQNKLEKRVINVSTMLNKIDREYHSTEFNSNFLNFRINSKKREVEQQLVNWEDGSHVLNCFICLQQFSFTLRKHHCRLCGRVVCGDNQTQCSMEIPVEHLTTLLDVPKVNNQSLIRMCKQCKDCLFQKRNFQRDLKSPLTPLLQKVDNQQSIKKAILVLMPRFEDILKRLQTDQNKSKSLTQEASRLRKRLVDSFASFDKFTKEIIALEGLSKDEELLQHAIKVESATFIQENMAPLKQLPQLLHQLEANSNNKGMSKPKYTREQVTMIKQRRQELMVLQEQRFLVEEMVSNCKKQRKFDELPMLQDNLKELNGQIEQVQNKLGEEGF